MRRHVTPSSAVATPPRVSYTRRQRRGSATAAHRNLDAHPGDLVGLARLLGHADLNTTAIYTQLTADEFADRLDRVPLNAYEEIATRAACCLWCHQRL
ncbi:MAG TPA: hypothetical protein VFW96_03700 [Thermomicrobiales bacterium]|nr:hypothetical protein [Thermomicrobiales bacterium]